MFPPPPVTRTHPGVTLWAIFPVSGDVCEAWLTRNHEEEDEDYANIEESYATAIHHSTPKPLTPIRLNKPNIAITDRVSHMTNGRPRPRSDMRNPTEPRPSGAGSIVCQGPARTQGYQCPWEKRWRKIYPWKRCIGLILIISMSVNKEAECLYYSYQYNSL